MTDDQEHRPKIYSAPPVTFVNRFYAPDMSATSQILTDVAEHLAAQGGTVSVVCSRASYGGESKFPSRELLNGVKIRRVWTTNFGRRTTIGRAIDYLSFYVSCTLFLLWHIKSGQALIAKTDPPMLSIPLGVVAKLKRARLINWLQDIFPEVATGIGFADSGNFLVRSLQSLRNRSLQKADANVVIGSRMAEAVARLGVSPDRIRVIHNFVDDTQIKHRREHSIALRRKWGISEDDFVVGYSGNLGRAHDLLTMLDAASSMQANEHIKFLFVGGGHLHERLKNEIRLRHLNNIVLQPYQPREELPLSLALPNLHWASLLPSLEGYILPSKIYGIAAAGRPLLMIGDKRGEIGRLLDEHQFGSCVPPGDHQSVERFILELEASPENTSTLGKNARQFIDSVATKERALGLWRETVL